MTMWNELNRWLAGCLVVWSALDAVVGTAAELPMAVRTVLESHCLECHDSGTKTGGFDLEALTAAGLPADSSDPATFKKWVRIHDRVRDGEMPPKEQLADGERSELLRQIRDALVEAENTSRQATGRSTLRRLNRTEYQNTLRDLLGLPALEVRDLLPEDGRVFGYDKSGPALEFSTVQIDKYIEVASKVLPLAITPYLERDEVQKARMYPGDEGAIMDGIINGCGVCLKDFRFDDNLFPLSVPSGNVPGGSGYGYFDQLKKDGKIPYRGSVGFMRNGDDYKPDFSLLAPALPGYYRVRASLWSFRWEKGEVKPTTPHIGRFFVETKHSATTNNSACYFDAPSLKPTESEAVIWLNPGETLLFQPASVLHDWQGIPYGKLAGYTGDGVAIDWVELEGPLKTDWPGIGHRRMFGDLPLVRLDNLASELRPRRRTMGQFRGGPQPFTAPRQNDFWTVSSTEPLADAEKLLAKFLPLAFRRPVNASELRPYIAIVKQRLDEKSRFEEALLTAYQTALCSPEFLLLNEPWGELDDFALASRLSYFLWNSTPDEELLRFAGQKKLRDRMGLRTQAERMLADPKGARFIADFTDQWLDLRLIDENSPHPKLYPDFSKLLRDSMVDETRAFFGELIRRDLPASNIVHSDFATLNQPLAEFYAGFGLVDLEDFTIPQEIPRPKQPRDTLPQPVAANAHVAGYEFREVSLSADSQRGGFLTQAAVLKVTANGTTTSPVRRGAWVQRKIVGRPPEPPPPNVPAVEPDTRGATTIRELLDKHRADAACAACHRTIDPPGFALESYDAIGGFRPRYRSLEKGDRTTRPPVLAGRHEFVLGLPVDPSGEFADGRTFGDIREFKQLLLKDERQIARNFVEQLVVYATGTPVSFADREVVERILDDVKPTHYGLRSIIHAVVQSELFLSK